MAVVHLPKEIKEMHLPKERLTALAQKTGRSYTCIAMVVVRLPKEIEERLTALAQKTGRSKSYYVRQALLEYLDDLEDYYLAVERLESRLPGIPLEKALRVEGEPPPVAPARPEEEETPALLRKVLARIEALEEEIQGLKRAIETLKKQNPKKPWWRFW